MNPRQKGWLDEVVHAYAAKHRPEVIEQVSNRKPLVHPTETFIAWAGSLDEGQGTTTAYKLQIFSSNTPIPRMT